MKARLCPACEWYMKNDGTRIKPWKQGRDNPFDPPTVLVTPPGEKVLCTECEARLKHEDRNLR